MEPDDFDVRSMGYQDWWRLSRKIVASAARVLAPFVVPLVIEYTVATVGQSDAWIRTYAAHQPFVWFGIIYGGGLSLGVALLIRAFRWYGVGMALVYVPVMYGVMLFYGVGLAGGI